MPCEQEVSYRWKKLPPTAKFEHSSDNGSGNNTILCSKFPFPNVFLSSSNDSCNSKGESANRNRDTLLTDLR